MRNQEMELMAHLMRRAGFGATRDELEAYVATGYDTLVEELLHPADPQNMPDDIIRRSHTEQAEMRLLEGAGANWLYQMITTRCPLEEKLALSGTVSSPLAMLRTWPTITSRFHVPSGTAR